MPQNVNRSTPTSTTLLFRLKNGEAAAWERFDAFYLPLVESWCRNLQIADRLNIAQIVTVNVHRKIAEFDRQRVGSFRKWLQVITANAVADLFEHSRNVSFEDLAAKLANPDDKQLSEEQRLLFKQVVVFMRSIYSEKWIRCFEGMVMHNVPVKQLAEELDMSEGAVRKSKYMVLNRLKKEFGDFLD